MTSSPAQRLKEAQLYLAERAARNPKLTPSITFGNASPDRPRYTGNNMRSARADADQHFQYTGAGFKPQIALSLPPQPTQKAPHSNLNRRPVSV